MQATSLNPMLDVPVPCARLCEETRELARRYLTGGYQSRLQDAGFRITELGLPAECPCELRHGLNTLLTARRSALHLLPEERLAGSAANLQALWHKVPGMAEDPSDSWSGPAASISHTTVDFGDAVQKGLSGLETEIRQRMAGDGDRHHLDFFTGLLMVIQAMRLWIHRQVDAYQELLKTPEGAVHAGNIRCILDTLARVPERPPTSFREAIQSFWSFFEFQRLCGNWSGLGRFDEVLGPYLARDLTTGAITLDEARELIAHFWIKGTEWCFGLRATSAFQPGSGDAQNYQNIILSGIDAQGAQIENEVTFLVLDVVEELHISDYPVTVRLNRRTSERLLKRIAEVQLLGGGIVSVYNEEVVLRGLENAGFSTDEARRFTNDGCWEIILPGRTNFQYFPQDMLQPFQKALFAEETPKDFNELYHRFLKHSKELFDSVRQHLTDIYAQNFHGKSSPGDYPDCPVTRSDVVLSLLEPACRRNGCSYTLAGTDYTIRAIHMAGLQDVANSLYAISELVFKQGVLPLHELVEHLKADWKNAEALRLRFANALAYYGNDDANADAMVQRVFDDCTALAGEVRHIGLFKIVVGVSTFGREIEWAKNRLATAYGKHAHDYLAPNMAPTPGTDKSPLTAVVNSYCRLDFTHTPNGCPLDLRLDAGIRKMPNAAELLAQVLRAFVREGGQYIQIDTVDPDMLRDAQKHPDRYPNLVVRISGWSARFASLDTYWQNLLINRTALGITG